MRFQADGPDIPFELIEARDAGKVIFLCGAGLSIPAGLPSFWGLTRAIIEDLGVPPEDRGRAMVAEALEKDDPTLAPPLDQVFGVLMRDYGLRQVEASVVKSLKTKRAPDFSKHETVLRLSTDPLGRRRVITTNFDRLFEAADRKLARIIPPALPDLDYAPALQGAVYLHGRLSTLDGQNSMGLVLGSSDFGRAYLAEGWATRFIRQVLDRYTLVLLGYSADDPPVRYLLEGLHAQGSERPAAIYAFASGEQVDADARWRERGVRPIVYSAGDRHGSLWRSLDSWARQADDPAAWRTSVATMAQQAPAALAPHERGQVAALVASPQGAKVFALTDPPPPAEWLCVFDPNVRLAKPYKSPMGGEDEPRDPRQSYALDSDPGPDEDQATRLDPLRPVGEERSTAPFAGLTLFDALQPPPMAARLHHLGHWMSKVALQPAALWWAAGQHALHPTVMDGIDRQLGFQPAGENRVEITAWRLLFEAIRDRPSEYRAEWYDLRGKVAKTGWTPGLLRDLKAVLRPRLKPGRPQFRAPFPPDSFDSLGEVIEFEVDFLEMTTDELDFDDNMLAPIVSAWRQGLIVGAELLTEAGDLDRATPVLIPQGGTGERYVDERGGFFLSFAGLFERLATYDVAAARAELEAWPKDESFFFDKLRVWAWRREDLATAARVADDLLAMSEQAFWGDRRDREFLLTLKERWGQFEATQRLLIEARLVAGPAIEEGETAQDHAQRRAVSSATRLGWLQLQGCALSQPTLDALPALRAGHPRWTPAWDEHAADSWEGGSWTVQEDPDPEPLLTAPMAQLAEIAEAAEGRDEFGPRRAVPFRGLLAKRPARALAIIGYEHRAGRPPQRLWSQLLTNNDTPLTPRLRRLIAGRLLQLPDAMLIALRFETARWIDAQLVALQAGDQALAWKLWDRHFQALVAGGESAVRSSISVSGGHMPHLRSRKTIEHAINSPVGVLAQALLKILESRKPRSNAALPKDIETRFDQVLTAPHEGGDHAVSVLCRATWWLDAVNADYVTRQITPLFQLAHPRAEAAWSGYLAAGKLLSPTRFGDLKAAFLDLFGVAANWPWAKPALARMADFLVVMSLERSRGYVTLAETRRALQRGGEEAMMGAINSLYRRLNADKRTWPPIKRFLTSAWPRELRLNTTALSKRLADLPVMTGEAFPDAVETVLPLLRPVDQLNSFLYRATREKDEAPSPVERFPRACLKLLDAVIAPSPPRPPHDLARVLEAIAEASPDLRTTLAWKRLITLTI
jgi:hypothetical protein